MRGLPILWEPPSPSDLRGHQWAQPVMQDLAADQLTDDSDLRLGVRSPRQHVPPAIFFLRGARFYGFPCFLGSYRQSSRSGR